jgi:DNA-binding CsgD family transcriptional regulator
MQSASVIIMESLSINDLELLNWGIRKVYTLSDASTFGIDALSIVHQLVPCDWPLFQSINLRTRAVEMTLLPGDDRSPLQIQKLVREVLPQYLLEYPMSQNISVTPGGVYKISDFLSKEELYQRAGIYQQFLQPLNLEEQMHFFLPIYQPGDWLSIAQADMIEAGFILNHSRRFTERDRLTLSLIQPHLSLAYENVQRYQQLKQNLESLQQSVNCIGLIIIDIEGLVKQATVQALDWLETYFPTATERNHLPDRLWSWVRYQVANLSSTTDLARPCLPLYIEQCKMRLVIRLVIEPDRNQYLLLLEEQTQSGLKSLELLGLSQRETKVLGLVIQGKDNRTIAAELGVGSSTVRKHLEHVYRKLGVQSRTEAIACALQQLGVLS